MAKTPVFLSWSGELSRNVAEQFASFLPTVVQAVQPFFSPKDIDKGSRWSSELKRQLEAAQGLGVFFVAKANVESSWLNFEAGSIASLGEGRVCTFLIDLEPGALLGYPLSAFQSTKFDRADILRLCETINSRTEEKVDLPILHRTYGLMWQELHDGVVNAIAAAQKLARQPPQESVDSAALDRASLTRIENTLAVISQRLDRVGGAGYLGGVYEVKWDDVARQPKAGMLFKTEDAAYKLLVEEVAHQKTRNDLLIEALRKGEKKSDEDPEPMS